MAITGAHRRGRLVVVASLVAIPVAACADKEGSASDPYGNLTSATTSRPSESSGSENAATSDSATGETSSASSTDATSFDSTGGTSSSGSSATTDVMTSAMTTAGDATTGGPNPVCVAYAAKQVECARTPMYDEAY